MAWRVHLTDRVVYRIDVLTGKRSVVVAWPAPHVAHFFSLGSGAAMGERTFLAPTLDRESEDWRTFLEEMEDPLGTPLPQVRLPRLTIHATATGVYRLYDGGDGLTFEDETGETPLADAGFVAVTMDRQQGMVAALDEGGLLHLYRRTQRIGRFDIGLAPEDVLLPELAIADNGGILFASDGAQVVAMNRNGGVVKRLYMPYPVGRMACSPDGRLFATTDTDTGVLRIYTELQFTHQKFAIDLLADATQVQLLAEMPVPTLATSALALTNHGVIAFAMDGVLCVTTLGALDSLPRAAV